MAKKKVVIGAISKRKDGSKVLIASPYELKALKNALSTMNLDEKKYFNIETKQEQLANIKEAVSAGRMSEESAAKVEEIINKIPDFVIAQISFLVDA